MQRSVLPTIRSFIFPALFFLLTLLPAAAQDYQKFRIMLNLTPGYTWFQTDNPRDVQTRGGTFAYDAGMKLILFFQKNYAFSTGIFYLHTGGKISYSDSVTLMLKNPMEIPPDTRIKYSINYLDIPLGLRLHTVSFGYMRYFFEPGMDVMFSINPRAGVPAYFDGKETSKDDIDLFNIAFHVIVGFEYSVGGGTALTGGISYMRGLLDMTKDAAGKPNDKLVFNTLGLKLGVIF
jgi:hypothetical protein